MKIIKKGLVIVLAIMLMTVNFACIANAAEGPSLSHPVKYAYIAKVYLTNNTGDYIDEEANIDIYFYLNKKSYKNGDKPYVAYHAQYNGEGRGEGEYYAAYVATYTKEPPASLYWVAKINFLPDNPPIIDTVSPMSGTAQAQRLD